MKFESVEALEKLILHYFHACKPLKADGPPPTMSGLAYALETSRQTLLTYADKSEFLDTINKARNRVEVYLEQRLDDGQVAGTIFNLKNNFSWQDVQNIEKTEERTTRVITADESKV
jgi:hypothetical protein